MNKQEDYSYIDLDHNEGEYLDWWTSQDTRWRLFILAVEILLSIIILCGNGLVIAAYIRAKKLQNLTHFFLINLAIADFIVGLAVPVKIVTQFLYLDDWRTSYYCVMQFSVVATPLAVSALCLLLITTERYICITQPYKSQHSLDQNKKLKYILIVGAWVIALTVMVLLPLFWMRKDSDGLAFKQAKCNLVVVVPSEYWKYVVLPLAFTVFAAVSLMYLRILLVARQQIKNIQLLVVKVSKEDKVNMQNIKLMKTGFILLGFFLLCWLPFTISLSTALTFQIFHIRSMEIALVCTATLTTVSSALNPLVYAARIRRFRLELKRILRLTIKNSDKYETYEIRRTFKVKRSSALASFYTNPMMNTVKKDDSIMESDEILTVSTSETEAEIKGYDSVNISMSPEKLSSKPSTEPKKLRSPFRSKTIQEKRSMNRLTSESSDEDDYIEITITRTITTDMGESSDDDESIHSHELPKRTNSISVAKLIAGHVNAGTATLHVPSSDELIVNDDGPCSPVQQSPQTEAGGKKKKRKYRRQVAKSLPLDMVGNDDSSQLSPKLSTAGLVNHDAEAACESQPKDEETLNHFLRQLSTPTRGESAEHRLNKSIESSPSRVKFQLDIDQIDLQFESRFATNQNRPNILPLPSVRQFSRKFQKTFHTNSRKPSPAADCEVTLTRAKSLNHSNIPANS